MPAPPDVVLGIVLEGQAGTQLHRLARAIACMQPEMAPATLEVRWLDNSTGSALRAAVSASAAPGRYHHAGTNLGFGAAHNQLMAEAFAKEVPFYFCLSAEAVPHPRCLAELLREASQRPRAGLIEACRFPQEHPKVFDPASHQTPWCTRDGLLIRRTLFDAIGGFDEQLSGLGEDVDLSWRAQGAGFETVLAPDALVYPGPLPSPEAGPGRLLEAGAYLARKYGDRHFLRRCLRELRALKQPLPHLPTPPPLDKRARAAADFSHGLGFAEQRW